MNKKNIGLILVLLAMLGLATQADITSSVISAADTDIRDATATYGSNTFMYIFGSGTANYMGYVRFDLRPLHIDNISNASLRMTVSGNTGARNDSVVTGRFALHGLYNTAGNTPQNWDEATLNQTGTGLEVSWTTRTLDMARVLDMDSNANSGVMGANGITETIVNGPGGGYARGTTITVIGAPLVSFLNSRADDDGLVTFIINGEMTNTRGYGLVTREETVDLTYRPTLELTYTSEGASQPQPVDGALVSVAIPQLSWSQLESYPKCDVYFGLEPNLLTMEKLTFTPAMTSVNIEDFPSYSVPLDPNTYYWRVDCYKGDPLPAEANLPGLFWSFEATDKPLVLTNPAPQFKFVGETAVFTAAFDSIYPITYTWYRSVDNANDTPGDDVSVGTNSTTLTVSNVGFADEGFYYCQAANPKVTASTVARLSIKELVAHWTLDGNADDSSGNGYNGTLFGTPVFDVGAKGQAMIFDGTDDYIDEPNGFDDFAPGVTITVWAKPAVATSWARFVDFANGPDNNNIFLTRNGTTANLTFNVYAGTTSAGAITANNAITLGEWQMFAATLDESRNVVLYKNGFSIATGTVNQMPPVIARTSNFIGDSNWTADAFYNGMMDEIFVYNYARTADEIALAYADVAGNFCRTRPAYDWDNTCKVDLGDIQMFAATWLDCGLYPECP